MGRDSHLSSTMYTCFSPGDLGIDLPFPEAAQLGSDCGFEGIQVDLSYLTEHGPEEYRGVLSTHGFRPGTLALPVDIDAGEREYERQLDALADAAERAAAIGCTRCSTYVMSFSDERPFEENFEFHRRRLAGAAEILADHSIDLGLEFLGPETLRDGHEYEFVHTAEGMLELCDAIDPDSTGLLLDSWHWYTSGASLETLHALDADDIVDVHVNDAPSGVPLEQLEDTVRRLPGETGVIDIESFLQHLADVGYDGPVSAEPFSERVEAMPADEAAAETRESMQTVWDRAGL